MGTKLDVVDDDRVEAFFSSAIEGRKVAISSVMGRGIDELKDAIVHLMEDLGE